MEFKTAPPFLLAIMKVVTMTLRAPTGSCAHFFLVRVRIYNYYLVDNHHFNPLLLIKVSFIRDFVGVEIVRNFAGVEILGAGVEIFGFFLLVLGNCLGWKSSPFGPLKLIVALHIIILLFIIIYH